MNIFDRVLDLSLRKMLRRGLAYLGQGDPWLDAPMAVCELLGHAQASEIAAMPRYRQGSVRFMGLDMVFSDNLALLGMLDEIFIRRNYAFVCSSARPLILDCGANIGIGVAFFKKMYPHAEIHAFEPDEDAFECLSENVRRNKLSGVFLHNKAVWVKDGELEFYSDASWGGGINEKQGSRKTLVGSVDLSKYLGQHVDFLKMDIEGAEGAVIEHVMQDVFSNVDRFFFEWHSMKNKPQKLGALLAEFENAGFRYHIKEASTRISPFVNVPGGLMDSQLDIFLQKPMAS